MQRRKRKHLSFDWLEQKVVLDSYFLGGLSQDIVDPTPYQGSIGENFSQILANSNHPLYGSSISIESIFEDSDFGGSGTISWGDGSTSVVQGEVIEPANPQTNFPGVTRFFADPGHAPLYQGNPTVDDHAYSAPGTYGLTFSASGLTYNVPVVISSGQLKYDVMNGSASVTLPTVPGSSFPVPNDVIGHSFTVSVVAPTGKTVDHVDWTIPDAIKTSAWDPTTGFFEQYLPAGYTVTSSNGSLFVYWAHGNPNDLANAPASSLGTFDFQKITAHVVYTDSSTEDLNSQAPVYAPQASYTATYATTSYGPQNTFASGAPSIMTGVAPSTLGSPMITEGYVGTLLVDSASTYGFGGNAGLLQTVNPDMTRLWHDTNGLTHQDRMMQSMDLVTQQIGYNPPYLDTRSHDTTVLYDYTPVGTPMVRKDSPFISVEPDMIQQYIDDKFYVTAMYRPGNPNDSNSIPVPLFKTSWEWAGELSNSTPGGFGSNYTLTWKEDPHATMAATATADYPVWHANAAAGGVQVSYNWLYWNQWGGYDMTPGPHAPTWFGSSVDQDLEVLVSTTFNTNSQSELIPMLAGSTTQDQADSVFDAIPVRKRDRIEFKFLNSHHRFAIG